MCIGNKLDEGKVRYCVCVYVDDCFLVFVLLWILNFKYLSFVVMKEISRMINDDKR